MRKQQREITNHQREISKRKFQNNAINDVKQISQSHFVYNYCHNNAFHNNVSLTGCLKSKTHSPKKLWRYEDFPEKLRKSIFEKCLFGYIH